MSETPHVSVVIPVYNERDTIEEILVRVQAVDVDKEILLVDDCSTDGSGDLLREIDAAVRRGDEAFRLPRRDEDLDLRRLRVLFQDSNAGKGAALRRGFREAVGDVVLIQDADLEYDPNDYHGLLAPIEEGRADVVYGSRFAGAGAHRVLYFWHSVGNRFLTLLSNMLTDLNLDDVWTCYKVFRREVLEGMELTEDRFGFEVEVTAEIARRRLRIYEVPIDYHGRTYEEGKKITWRDGIKAIWQTFRYGLFR